MNTPITLQIWSIPDEIFFFEILKRLPVKTLCRFKTVSKLWLSIITSRPFIDSHYQHSKLNPEFLLGFYNADIGTEKFFSMHNPQTISSCKFYPYWSISSRGLICFYGGDKNDDTVIRIWNPSTGENIELSPKSPRRLHKTSAFFLGFDTVSKKHKVLSSGNRENYVLTLGENKWRKMSDELDGTSRYLTKDYSNCPSDCSLDGIVYYLAKSDDDDDKNKSAGLVGFDFGSESFLETIHLPCRFDDKYKTLGIMVYRGRIVWMGYKLNTKVEMWVLEDDENWSLIKRVIPRPPPSPLLNYLGVIDGEELVLYSIHADANSSWFQFCRYDLEKDTWTETRSNYEFLNELHKPAGNEVMIYYGVRLYYYAQTLEPLNFLHLSIQEEEEEKN